MAQLWGGRFTKETDKLVYNFNASISFDQKFYRQDIRGSIAHVTMLASSGILTDEERDQIIAGLKGILNDVENGSLQITSEYTQLCRGKSHRQDRRCGQKAPHRTKQERPGRIGHEALCKRRDHRAQGAYLQASDYSSRTYE